MKHAQKNICPKQPQKTVQLSIVRAGWACSCRASIVQGEHMVSTVQTEHRADCEHRAGWASCRASIVQGEHMVSTVQTEHRAGWASCRASIVQVEHMVSTVQTEHRAD